MDEMRRNMKDMLQGGAIGFRIFGHIIWMSLGQVLGAFCIATASHFTM